MVAAIDVQQHARQRPPLAPLPIRAPLATTGDKPGSLQHPFHPAVAELDLVLGLEFFVKVAHVQIEIPVAIEGQHPSTTASGTRLGEGLPSRR